MKIKGLLTDRQILIHTLEQEIGEKAEYSGMPSFRYQVGPYTILRDGTMEVSEKDADKDLLARQDGLGLIEWGKKPKSVIYQTQVLRD